MGRITTIVIILVAAAVLGLGLFHNLSTSQAQEKDSIAGVMNKLQEVIRNQQIIIKELEEIKQELYIIKVRATR